MDDKEAALLRSRMTTVEQANRQLQLEFKGHDERIRELRQAIVSLEATLVG